MHLTNSGKGEDKVACAMPNTFDSVARVQSPSS